MTHTDLIAKLRATADARDDAVSDLLLEAADALEAERRDAVAFVRVAGGLKGPGLALQIEHGDHEGAAS